MCYSSNRKLIEQEYKMGLKTGDLVESLKEVIRSPNIRTHPVLPGDGRRLEVDPLKKFNQSCLDIG